MCVLDAPANAYFPVGGPGFSAIASSKALRQRKTPQHLPFLYGHLVATRRCKGIGISAEKQSNDEAKQPKYGREDFDDQYFDESM